MQNLLGYNYALGGLFRAEAACGASSDVRDLPALMGCLIDNSVVVLCWGLHIPFLVFMP